MLAMTTNPFALALASGYMKATYTGNEDGHITVAFKAWARGRRGRVPVAEADRIYIQIPSQAGWPDKVGYWEPERSQFHWEPDADPARIEAAMHILNRATTDADEPNVVHPGSCMICGRELTDPESIERGIGPHCYGKATETHHQHKNKLAQALDGLEIGDIKIKLDGEDVKVVPKEDRAPHVYVSMDEKQIGVDMGSDFNYNRLNSMKAVTKGRHYDSYTKVWWIDYTPANLHALIEWADAEGLIVEQNLRDDAAVTPKEEIVDVLINTATSEGHFQVLFDFGPRFDEILGAIRSIPTERKFHNDRVDGKDVKYWWVKATPQAALTFQSLQRRFNVKVSERGQQWIDELVSQADEEAKAAEFKIKLSEAKEADPLDIDGFDLTLDPYQNAGVLYGDYARGRYMIADQQGLGKTIEALAAMKRKDTFPAVIVTPSNVKYKWGREVVKCYGDQYSVDIVEGQKPYRFTADILIINWDILTYHVGNIVNKFKPKALILDESHYAKNRKAQRTIAAKAIANAIPKSGLVIETTGTPVLNRPLELVEQLDIIGRLDDFGGFAGFVSRYVGWEENGYAGTKIPAKNGAMNLPELNEKLRATCYVRRLKKDVLTELPEKRRDVIPVEIDMKAHRKRVAAALDTDNPLAEFTNLRVATGLAKIQPTIEWVRDFMQTGEKLVLYAYHNEVQDALVEEFTNGDYDFDVAILRGSGAQTKKQRDEANVKFMEDPNCRLAICSIMAAKEGIDLYSAANLAFVEFAWGPTIHDQAEDRIHRRGQDRGTMMYYLAAKDTFDEAMVSIIEDKRKIVEATTEGRNVTDEDEGTKQKLLAFIREQGQ